MTETEKTEQESTEAKTVEKTAEAPPAAKQHWLVRKSTIRLLWVILAIVLAATIVAGLYIHPHVYFGIDGTPAFYAWFGLGSCIIMVLVAKLLGVLIKRPDDYYDAE